jgi:hypothetical protein
MMKRRQVLGAMVATVAAPAWIRRAFAQEKQACRVGDAPGQPVPPAVPRYADVPGDIPSSLARAAAAGKPLLVLVVPAAAAANFSRATAFGAWINYGGDERLALLAACEVTCAKMEDVRAAAPQVGPGEPLMVLLEPGPPVAFQRIEGTLPQPAGREGPDGRRDAEEDRIIDQRIEYLSDSLRQTLVPNAAAYGRLSALARARLPAELVQRVDRALAAGRTLPTPDVDRAAGVVLAAAMQATGAARSHLFAMLAEAANERLRDHRVPGSRWAHGSGCGTSIEGEPISDLVACGMGHVPARSARFLDFLVNAQRRG